MDYRTQWRGQRDTLRKRFLAMVGLSLVLHAPFSPLAGLLGLLQLRADEDVPPADPITAIPIELLETDESVGAAEAPPSTPPPVTEPSGAEAATPVPAPRPPRRDPEPRDAGVEAGADAQVDAGADAASDGGSLSEPDAGSEPTDAGAPSDAGRDAGRRIADPVALSGAAGRVADPNANVRVFIYTEKIRRHPLGRDVSTLLASVEQWRDFFGTAGIDPIRDIDRLLIAGPQLRRSEDVVAVLRYNTTPERVRAGIEALVQRPDAPGEWLDAGVPAARARADRAERIFVMAAPQVVVVTPPSAAASALKLPPTVTVPPGKGEEVLTAYVATPWRALAGLPFRFPRTIQSARIKVVPTEAGGAVAHLELADESADTAAENAQLLSSALLAAANVNLGFMRISFVERVEFRAQGSKIVGEVEATQAQLRRLLAAVTSYAQSISPQRSRAVDAGPSLQSGSDEPPAIPRGMPR